MQGGILVSGDMKCGRLSMKSGILVMGNLIIRGGLFLGW